MRNGTKELTRTLATYFLIAIISEAYVYPEVPEQTPNLQKVA